MNGSHVASSFPISGLRSVELEVPDPIAAMSFYTDIWGLIEADRDRHTVWLRASGSDPYVARLSRGPVSAVVSTTFRAAPDTDLAALQHRMMAAGGSAEGGPSAVRDLGGGEAIEVRDRVGRLLRVVRDDERATPLTARDSRPERLAHVNINCADIDRDVRFYEEGLGFRLTDRSTMMAFLRTNWEHHSVVLARANVDTLNHIAFNHGTWEDVMIASGRMCAAGFPIGWGPGRHGPGNNIFAYFVDPFGVVIEHTAEVLIVDDDYRVGGPDDWRWPPGRTDQWGIAPPKMAACKAAQLAIPFI